MLNNLPMCKCKYSQSIQINRRKVVFYLLIPAFIVSLSIISMFSQTGLAEVIYVDVDANGTNHGSSWEDAYLDLQDALFRAQPGDQIWVAKGTYYPGSSRDAFFVLKKGVAIYGGFVGTEIFLEERVPSQHKTLLSGDVGIPGDNLDNCYHVFYHAFGSDLDSTAILDGFTITGGNANGESQHSRGGGMYNNSSTAQVINCIFEGNSAIYGGGIYNASNPRFVNVIISNNMAENSGGGMDNSGSSPLLINCAFIKNKAINFGGGMSNDLASPKLINCLFYNNSAIVGVGGGLSNYTYSNAILINCTVFENSAGDLGGGMWNGGASPVATNCIFWGNTSNQIYGGGFPQPIITYSDVQGGYEGIGNINSDPLFIDPINGDLHLREDSPVIDAGNPDVSFNDACQPPGLGTNRNDMGIYGGPSNCPEIGISSIRLSNLSPIEVITPFLLQNYPNPFNTSTTISFTIGSTNHVQLSVEDILGRSIRTLKNERQSAGFYDVNWDGKNENGALVSSGIYFYTLKILGNKSISKRMLMLK
jgi:hypothetical protein